MRIRLGFAAITVAALTVVACQPDAPDNQRTPLVPDACAFVQGLPGYSYQGPDGRWVHVQDGAIRVEEWRSDPSVDLERACASAKAEYLDNR